MTHLTHHFLITTSGLLMEAASLFASADRRQYTEDHRRNVPRDINTEEWIVRRAGTMSLAAVVLSKKLLCQESVASRSSEPRPPCCEPRPPCCAFSTLGRRLTTFDDDDDDIAMLSRFRTNRGLRSTSTESTSPSTALRTSAAARRSSMSSSTLISCFRHRRHTTLTLA